MLVWQPSIALTWGGLDRAHWMEGGRWFSSDNEIILRVGSPALVSNTRFVKHGHCDNCDNSGKKNTPKSYPGLPHTLLEWSCWVTCIASLTCSGPILGCDSVSFQDMYLCLYASTLRNRCTYSMQFSCLLLQIMTNGWSDHVKWMSHWRLSD